jgi:hypothetical protein
VHEIAFVLTSKSKRRRSNFVWSQWLRTKRRRWLVLVAAVTAR